MNEAKGRSLERAGWKLGTPKEFLGLTDEETALIEIKVALARGIKLKSDGSLCGSHRKTSRSK